MLLAQCVIYTRGSYICWYLQSTLPALVSRRFLEQLSPSLGLLVLNCDIVPGS